MKISKYKKAVLWGMMLERHGRPACHYCQCSITKQTKEKAANRATIDHIIPISKGGTNIYENLVWSCRKCNIIKGNHYEE